MYRKQQCVTFFSSASDTNAAAGNASSNNNNKSLSHIRTSILTQALMEVHHYGWTDDALAAATMSIQQASTTTNTSGSMSVVGMITVDDLIGFCMNEMNRQLAKDLMEKQQQQHAQTSSPSSSQKNISHYAELNAARGGGGGATLEEGMRTRLEYLVPYLKSGRWHEGMALGVRGPTNALKTRKQLQELVDILVQHTAAAGSDAAQLSTPERMALGAVYVTTELHMLTDTSPGYHDTWAFLSSRMEDWRRLGNGSFVGGSPSHNTAATTGIGGGLLPSNASDALFVTSSVASSLVGGALSLAMNTSQQQQLLQSQQSIFGLPQQVLSALFQSQHSSTNTSNSDWQGKATAPPSNSSTSSKVDGTMPNHYDVPRKDTL